MKVITSHDDYSVFALIQFIWKKRFSICGGTFASMVMVVIWSLTLDNTYQSNSILSPTEEASVGGGSPFSDQLGGLASLAGISVPSGGVDQLTEALAILNSRYFMLQFIKKYNLEVPIIAGEKWDESSGQLEIDESLYDSDAQLWVRDLGKRPSAPTDLELYEAWLELFVVEKDPSTGLVKVSIEFLSPILAQQWLEWLIKDINEEMRQLQIQEATANISYLESKVNSIDNIDMRNVFYQLILEQTQKLMLAEVREDFMFKVIDPPALPEKRFAPNRTLICLVAGVLSGFFMLSIYSLLFLILPRQ